MVTVLFHRSFQRFYGGHLKMWDYFNHIAAIPGLTPQIYFSPESCWDETNPWSACREAVLPTWTPERADVLFLGGKDWERLPSPERADWPRPVLNLVQHVRHADPADPLSSFLTHRAIRICYSPEVAEALGRTGRVNGPMVLIPLGCDFSSFPPVRPWAERSIDLLVCGLKQPDIARRLTDTLAARTGRNQRIETLVEPLPRPRYLDRLADARWALFLPHVTEGFYLPALEAMATRTLVLCPDVVGNRSFCRPEETALMPTAYREQDLVALVARAEGLTQSSVEGILARAESMAQLHTLAREQKALAELLANLPELW